MDIIARDHGINWTWYHWMTVGDGVVTVTWSDRFHKFESDRGADNHPETDWTVEFFLLSEMGYSWPLHLRERRLEQNAKIRAQHGWDDDVTEYCTLHRSGGKLAFFAVIRG